MGNNNKWKEEPAILKSIIEKTELIPEIKWGTEIYTFNEKNVVGFLGFRDFFLYF